MREDTLSGHMDFPPSTLPSTCTCPFKEGALVHNPSWEGSGVACSSSAPASAALARWPAYIGHHLIPPRHASARVYVSPLLRVST